MEELMVIANVAIVFGVIYKLFELFVGRKERMMLIEKLPPEMLNKGTDGHLKLKALGFSNALRYGCLFLGIGLGLITGYCIICNTLPEYFSNGGRHANETASIIYAASVLIGGGVGLIAAFLVELKLNKKKEE